MPDFRTTDRYTKFDKRFLAVAQAAIESYLRDLKSAHEARSFGCRYSQNTLKYDENSGFQK
jgi:hypothetical protein